MPEVLSNPVALIESLDHEGRGVAHVDGKAIFIEGALPGERVEYSSYRKKPSYEKAQVVRIIKAASQRVTPRCPHFGMCGGCSMQHLDPDAQASVKQRVLEDAFWHIGQLRPEVIYPPITGPASAFSPLDVPNFGANYRANTDTQSPNFAQQEPSIGVNPLNPLNVVVAAKDERQGTNTKHVYIYTSTDGGVTWINQRFPYRLPAPGYSSDPVVNFADDGVVFVTSLPYGGGTSGIASWCS